MLSYHNYLASKLNRVVGDMKACKVDKWALDDKIAFIGALLREIQMLKQHKLERNRDYNEALHSDYIFWRDRKK